MIYALMAILLFSGTFVWAVKMFYRMESPVSLLYNDKQVVMQGQQLYTANCASCHGKNLEGQPDWQSRDAAGLMPAPSHDKSGHTWHHADELLFELTKFGLSKVVGADYKSNMPAFKDRLSDQEIIAVLSYIKSTWPPEIIANHANINAAYKSRNATR